MHALTVEEEPQEGMPPGEVNDREFMARVSLAWSKCNRLMCLLQLQDLVVDCLVGNPPWEEVKIMLRLCHSFCILSCTRDCRMGSGGSFRICLGMARS